VGLDAAALAALAALALGAWPALKRLHLPRGGYDARLLTVAATRAGAPALEFVATTAEEEGGE
jgi:hypothetical protein